tara:strand:+ start:365 stop:730 length:366 start_codon:yes stop_codon:yes gene_type:complete
MYRLAVVLLTTVVLTTGCAGSNGPNQGNPCKERSFDEWLSFYDLKDKANSSWDEGYAHAFVWLEDVAHACYPDKFESDNEVVKEISRTVTCSNLTSSDLELSYIAKCDILTLDSYRETEIE